MQRVQLPPGCSGFRCADGTVYKAKPGTSVVLEDQHAKSLSVSQHASIGLVKAGESFALGTKRGRWCPGCARMWQAWSLQCPRCGQQTVPDAEDAAAGETSPEQDAPAASIQSSPARPSATGGTEPCRKHSTHT